jgi:hypothetical protein
MGQSLVPSEANNFILMSQTGFDNLRLLEKVAVL